MVFLGAVTGPLAIRPFNVFGAHRNSSEIFSLLI